MCKFKSLLIDGNRILECAGENSHAGIAGQFSDNDNDGKDIEDRSIKIEIDCEEKIIVVDGMPYNEDNPTLKYFINNDTDNNELKFIDKKEFNSKMKLLKDYIANNSEAIAKESENELSRKIIKTIPRFGYSLAPYLEKLIAIEQKKSDDREKIIEKKEKQLTRIEAKFCKRVITGKMAIERASDKIYWLNQKIKSIADIIDTDKMRNLRRINQYINNSINMHESLESLYNRIKANLSDIDKFNIELPSDCVIA
jgi:predicted transglutaminase-like cysteine proteinase